VAKALDDEVVGRVGVTIGDEEDVERELEATRLMG
jgi:hypothetical protein